MREVLRQFCHTLIEQEYGPLSHMYINGVECIHIDGAFSEADVQNLGTRVAESNAVVESPSQ